MAEVVITGQDSKTLAAVGEFGLIRALSVWLPPGARTLVGIGDDAAVLAVPDGRVVATTDFLLEGRHFRLDWASAADVGHKAAARSLADLAAMGAASATSRADGSAPMAATSARLRAAALCPTSAAPAQSRRKCLPSSRKSVVATTRPSGVTSTAASSPMPTSAFGPEGSHADSAVIRPNSPTSASVCGSCPVITHPSHVS